MRDRLLAVEGLGLAGVKAGRGVGLAELHAVVGVVVVT